MNDRHEAPYLIPREIGERGQDIPEARQLADIFRDRPGGSYDQRTEKALFDACWALLKTNPLAAPMVCEQHPHLEWPHIDDVPCPGPGMWITLPEPLLEGE